MATAEGTFPKVGNDPFYASEVNRFSPKLIGNVSQGNTFTLNSGTAYTTIDTTIFYSGAGPIQISEFMNLQGSFQSQGGARILGRFRISGTAGLDMTTTIHDTGVSMTSAKINLNHVLTSGVITASGGNIGSTYILSLEGTTATNVTTRRGDFVVMGY